MKNLNPSNSIIKVVSTQTIISDSETARALCPSIVKDYSSERRFLIGHVSEKWFRPRIKGYEKHQGLKIKDIVILYGCSCKSEAHNMEAFLIGQFKSSPQNKNIRKESQFKGKEINEPYFVYLAME